DLPFTVWTSDASLVGPGGALLESQSSLSHFTRSTGQIHLSQTSSETSNSLVDPSVMAVHIISPELKLLTPLSAIKDAIAEAESAKAAATAAANAANVGEANKKQEQELKRLSKKLGNVQAELEKLGVRLGRPEYSERVPEKVQQLDAKRRVDLLAQEEHLLTTIKTLDNGF
ncbi:hypothetical protein BGZ95_007548, partial [Linnemannia exigua]